VNDAGMMKTYAAEINGEAVTAFRAMDDDDARDTVSDEDGDLQHSLKESSGMVRADGTHCRMESPKLLRDQQRRSGTRVGGELAMPRSKVPMR
jgi:hypothetical protein